MGANINSDREKCGDILINIKTLKNKAKGFTFHCALCSMDCDQLKKFSKHLENHLHYFDHDLKNSDELESGPLLIFEPEEIKVEEQLHIDIIDKGVSTILSGSIIAEAQDDPLETGKSCKNIKEPSNIEQFMSKYIKNEYETGNETKECESGSRKIPLDSSINKQKTVVIGDGSKKSIKSSSYSFIHEEHISDYSCNYSSDADFDFKHELKTTISLKKVVDLTTRRKSDISERRETSAKEISVNGAKNALSDNKSKRRRRVIIETVLPILIQQYKNHEILWQVDDIAFGVKNKKYETYSRIAEQLKSEANINMSLEDINYHINYLNELYSKDKEQELKCTMEHKVFSPVYEHYTKLSFLSNSQGPFLCEICNELLPKYDPYCQHMAQHNDTQPFKCSACGMMFTNYHKYLIHKTRHLGIYNFHCDICGKGYLFKNDLEWHVTSHTGDKPYLCPICGTGFRARHGYDNHIRRHEDRFRHECHICKRGFNQLHALNNHVKSHLNIRDVICKICGKGFVHTKYLKRHELIHGKEKRYKCNECGKAFFQPCGLRAHRKNHHS